MNANMGKMLIMVSNIFQSCEVKIGVKYSVINFVEILIVKS